MTEEQGNIGNVLSGKTPLKFEVSIDWLSAVYVGIAVLVAVALGSLVAGLIQKKL